MRGLLLFMVTGSLFNALSGIINKPLSIVNILAASLPSVSVYFINFLITQLLSGVPMVIFRYIPYLIYWLYRSCFSERKLTRRMLLNGPLAAESVDYGCELPPYLFTLAIMTIYWTISPIVALVATLFFGASYLAAKYNYLFVIVPEYESGGVFWYGLYEYSMYALLTSSLTMIGYMGLKKGAAQTPLLIPLPFLIIFAWRYTESCFKRISMNCPLSEAADIDRDVWPDYNAEERDPLKKKKPVAEVLKSFSPNFCRQPNLTNPSVVQPYPYRIDGIPLINDKGLISEVYHGSLLNNCDDMKPCQTWIYPDIALLKSAGVDNDIEMTCKYVAVNDNALSTSRSHPHSSSWRLKESAHAKVFCESVGGSSKQEAGSTW